MKNNQAKQRAKEHFVKLGYDMSKCDLHHIDFTLRTNNKKRYNEWRISDLIPLTRSEHMKLHMKIR